MNKMNCSFENFWLENGKDLSISKIEAKLIYNSGYEKRNEDVVSLRRNVSKICSIMDSNTPRIVLDIGIRELKKVMDND